MDLIKKFLILLAIFCVIGSAAVSAADLGSDDGGYAGSNSEDAIGVAGSNYGDSNGVAGSQYNPDDEGAGQLAAVEHDTNFVPDGTPDANHAAGEADNQTQGNATNEHVYAPDTFNSVPTSQSVYDNATYNGTASAGNTSAPQEMHSTGNPILALLAVGAVLGVSSIIRKK
jgi:hypothetical protein